MNANKIQVQTTKPSMLNSFIAFSNVLVVRNN